MDNILAFLALTLFVISYIMLFVGYIRYETKWMCLCHHLGLSSKSKPSEVYNKIDSLKPKERG